MGFSMEMLRAVREQGGVGECWEMEMFPRALCAGLIRREGRTGWSPVLFGVGCDARQRLHLAPTET